MQNLTDDQPIFRPNGAASAYGAVIRTTESGRDIEYRVFERVTAALQSAQCPEAHFTQKIKAAHDNRQLWQTLACDLADKDNALPPDLRARLIGLSIWVTRETDRALRSDGSLQDLIDINRTIMPGLQPAIRGAA
jgi:flagellar protein FlaF